MSREQILLLNAIEKEINLIYALKSKYGLNDYLLNYIADLQLKQYEVRRNAYTLKIRDMNNTVDLWTALFKNGSSFIYRHLKETQQCERA